MPEIKITTEFKTGTYVYLVTDPYQYKRRVVSITYFIDKSVMYGVALADQDITQHYSAELSLTEDIEMRQKWESDGDDEEI